MTVVARSSSATSNAHHQAAARGRISATSAPTIGSAAAVVNKGSSVIVTLSVHALAQLGEHHEVENDQRGAEKDPDGVVARVARLKAPQRATASGEEAADATRSTVEQAILHHGVEAASQRQQWSHDHHAIERIYAKAA